MEKERKTVERQYIEISLKLADSEATIKFLNRMCRNNLATNDVYNFARNQTRNRKASSLLDTKLLRISMRQKLNDACAHANRLRQTKNKTKRKLVRDSNGERKVWEKVVQRAEEKVRHRKRQRKRKDEIKFRKN